MSIKLLPSSNVSFILFYGELRSIMSFWTAVMSNCFPVHANDMTSMEILETVLFLCLCEFLPVLLVQFQWYSF